MPGVVGIVVNDGWYAQVFLQEADHVHAVKAGKLVDEYRRLLLLSTTDGKPAAIIRGRPLSGCRFM